MRWKHSERTVLEDAAKAAEVRARVERAVAELQQALQTLDEILTTGKERDDGSG